MSLSIHSMCNISPNAIPKLKENNSRPPFFQSHLFPAFILPMTFHEKQLKLCFYRRHNTIEAQGTPMNSIKLIFCVRYVNKAIFSPTI